MEILLEIVRTLSSSLARHTSSVLKAPTNRSKCLRYLVIKLGNCKHNMSVNMFVWGSIWRTPFTKRQYIDDTCRVEVVIKPIHPDEAIDIGTNLLAEFLLLTIMFTTMGYSIYLRRSRYNELLTKQKEQEAKILSRIECMEQEIYNLLEFKSEILSKRENV
ncbi:hypothetical protein BEWA_006810 [Theileria equi strain WA]|uniref:Uncharacterized protein n=1 Tax=Theileria equi strain WA TaxID=1537102 RepID=L0B088_THEEQ|nr:hypothetical protein BEWA_006810 [Theileria equi strain WA]AFZ81272.1 hypothetical protein BEWA_006810 [Theileria equi strain WA]|eukprot:XP_004830938.1 hypothetical protein BEWA_006810 [Theileria equi strain WA]